MEDEGVVHPFRQRFTVRSYETDARGTITATAVCAYLQEAAGNHAHALGVSVDQLHAEGLTWMLTRLRLECARLPRWREEVEIETWPSGYRGLLAFREFLLRAGQETVARATTAWMMIDLERRRPARLTDHIQGLRLPDRSHVLPLPVDRLDIAAGRTTPRLVDVDWLDMDVNRHVNNGRYVDWALRSIQSDVLDGHFFAALSVDFLGEARAGDSLRIDTSAGGDSVRPSFQSDIVTAEGEAPIARVVTHWRARPSGEAPS